MTLFILISLAIVFSAIDSSIGMMYGTLLAPILVALNYTTIDVTPSILISQVFSGVLGSIFHTKAGNFSYQEIKGISVFIVVFGLIASLVGVVLASCISDTAIRIYIASLAILMGLLCIKNVYFNFNKWSAAIVGMLASFNKAATGGGFGPICSTGLMVGGIPSKKSIALTTFSEVPLCLYSFCLYVLINNKLPPTTLALPLIVGACLGGSLGPFITCRIDTHILRKLAGILAVISGSLILIKILFL